VTALHRWPADDEEEEFEWFDGAISIRILAVVLRVGTSKS
jgi:hypothetical protein